ncbi:hypothetical protein PAPHI01_0969 [Pancytospora philotis]|nr:hypothetical protein PAPHI01_0969 [Pancytospora philotis]
MADLIELWIEDNPHHALRCTQIMRDSIKNIDSEIAMKIFNWERLSYILVHEDMVKFIEIITEMQVDLYKVTEGIIFFLGGFENGPGEARLSLLSDYFLEGLDINGQTRLKVIANDDSLINKLPRELTVRLLEDCTKRGLKHPNDAKYLTERLTAALKSKNNKSTQ